MRSDVNKLRKLYSIMGQIFNTNVRYHLRSIHRSDIVKPYSCLSHRIGQSASKIVASWGLGLHSLQNMQRPNFVFIYTVFGCLHNTALQQWRLVIVCWGERRKGERYAMSHVNNWLLIGIEFYHIILSCLFFFSNNLKDNVMIVDLFIVLVWPLYWNCTVTFSLLKSWSYQNCYCCMVWPGP